MNDYTKSSLGGALLAVVMIGMSVIGMVF